MAFWRRKKDEFVSLGLSRAANERALEGESASEAPTRPLPAIVTSVETDETVREQPASTPWQTSVLGLDLSIEQLQAQ